MNTFLRYLINDQKSGEHKLQVELEGLPILGSPFNLNVSPPRADAGSSMLVPPLSLDENMRADSTNIHSNTSPRVGLGSDGRARFTVQARDKYGKNYTKVDIQSGRFQQFDLWDNLIRIQREVKR